MHRNTSVALATVLIWLTSVGCSRSPEFGLLIGKTEREVEAEMGSPTARVTLRSEQMRDELRGAVWEKHLGKKTGLAVREVHYKEKRRTKVFWLTEQDGVWKVVDGVSIPDGVQF